MGGKGNGQGEREKTGENPRNKALWHDDRGGKMTRRNSVLMPQVRGKNLLRSCCFSILFKDHSTQAGWGQSSITITLGGSVGTNRLAHLLESPGACKETQLAASRVKPLMEWGWEFSWQLFRKANSCILAHSGTPSVSGASLTDCVWGGFPGEWEESYSEDF